ncbi:MAG: hypothetical protein AB1797_07085 [bacterium]
MSFIEALSLVGVAATILGVFVTVYAIINNKTLKKESKLTRETLGEALERESKLTRETLGEALERESKLTREALEKQSILTREMIQQTNQYLAKYLGDLIVAQRERTHQAV